MAAARRDRSGRRGAALRTAALALAALAFFAAGPGLDAPAEAWAQAVDDQTYLDSRERARQDWQAMSESASSLWEDARAALSPVLSSPGAMAVALGAAVLGGLLGAWARGGKAPPPSAPPRRPGEQEVRAQRRPAPRPVARREGEGMIFRGGPGGGRSIATEEPDDEPEEDDFDDDRRPASQRDVIEADRLFRFFDERFGLGERSATKAIDFFTRLSRSIEGLKRRAAEAERERDRLAEGGGASGASSAGDAGPDAAAWRMISDGMRLCRAVMQNQRGVDVEMQNFEQVVDLEETFVGLAELRAQHLQDGPENASGFDSRVIEQAWPHALFRAEALLQTYYPGRGVWGDLREGIGLIASALRRLLRSAGVSVSSATLLAPYEPEDGENWSDAAEDLTNLSQVRRRLQSAVEREGRPFVIDIESFGYRDGSRGVTTRARLILLDPEEWR